MRAIDCPCGHRLEGADDDELFRLAREHVDRDHPEMQRSDEEIRERVAADAYDAWVNRASVLDPEGAHFAGLERVVDFAGARVLEVGCGDGRLTVPVAQRAASVFAFDPDEEAVDAARGALPAELAGRVTFAAASAKAIEIPRSAFDIVLFSWSLWWVEPEDVVYVLRRLLESLAAEGIVLDLQVVRPHPLVEVDDSILCEIDGSPLFVGADAARDAVDLLVAEGLLEEEARDDHDVRKHYANGAALVDDFKTSKRRIPVDAIPRLQAIERECVVRERSRVRRLRLVSSTAHH